ncbi:Arginine biosynthesis bifunctional protein ArgJ [Halomonadaceae bacterium LMG 33818]|uniref:bifunctional glutamate N-acetyltransferase/amino-acid acetyltransferase ArgJ n=1 Tax=Cernens ardua TaxID=3402176 RepID=UPI003EDC70C9
MAVGESVFPTLPALKGVRIGVSSAGIKQEGRKDLVIFELDDTATVAGVFTRNAFCAAPVILARQALVERNTRYWLINTGNANAGTGEQGLKDAQRCCEALLAAVTQSDASGKNGVMPFSTGVIGEPLPVEKIENAIPAALADLKGDNWEAAGWGILTTDTRPKLSTRSLTINGETVTINGISKGSGMICPNMATMLSFVATDATVDADLLQQLLSDVTERTFNRITVDSDTSTNDACVLTATGKGPEIVQTRDVQRFTEALYEVMLELAQAIVRDGEGATKFIAVNVQEAASTEEALAVAYSIAHSPLVKTALYASDANWGRILMAVGKSGVVDLDVNRVSVAINGVTIAENGGRAPDYTEEAGSEAVAQEEITILVRLARGGIQETVWTSDLSHEYVSINADYRS